MQKENSKFYLVLMMTICLWGAGAWSQFQPSAMAQTGGSAPAARPIALFLDCNIGTHYVKAIKPTMKKRDEELVVVPCKDFAATMERLAQQNVYVKTLFASGHDGNRGVVYPSESHIADKGVFDILRDVPRVNAKYPQLFAQTQTYYPLGCYTESVPNLQAYEGVLPSLQYVSGFYGAAHSAHRKISQDSLVEMLEAEEKILQAASLREFERAVSGLKSLKTDLNIGVYRRNVCRSRETESGSAITVNGFMLNVDRSRKIFEVVDFNIDKCLEKLAEFELKLTQVEAYASAVEELPIDTGRGPLRDLYGYFRQNEYCYDHPKFKAKLMSQNLVLAGAEDVFSLLFHRNYRRNFAAYYKKDIAATRAQLSELLKEPGLPSPARTALARALRAFISMMSSDMGTWSMAEIYNMSVNLSDVSDQLSRLAADGTPLCGKMSKVCAPHSVYTLASQFTELIVDRRAKYHWHEFSPGRVPRDPLAE